jgi:hypothetical protein
MRGFYSLNAAIKPVVHDLVAKQQLNGNSD